ncbi:uncharacterized protein LOC133295506 [Gastrolobium bilobum]|uniref:uncharacterized protein LOC133295506 n=1 Tax=Gastrolobium bilobum TaxID=150636 RepID=UPI002AAF7100|nr:uncharacterized protein LOC133295506 [Gastrolobium bilobum]
MVYANPREEAREELWMDIKRISGSMGGPWAMMRDFNEIASPKEKIGGAPVNIARCQKFSYFLNDCHMLDLGCRGSKFTWRGPKWLHLDRVFKRLDRICSNAAWRTTFGDADVRALPRLNSDRSSGNHQTKIITCLDNLIDPLKSWNKRVFGCIRVRKDYLLKRIQETHNNNTNQQYLAQSDLEFALQEELNRVLEQEEALWFQKARCKWIEDGDRNTRFYHTTTIIRRARNKILELKKEEGHWVKEEDSLNMIIHDFFTNLFKEEDHYRPWEITNTSWPALEETELTALKDPISELNIKEAFFSMNALKAPGPDGFPAFFFQKNWEIMRKQVVDCVHQIWDKPEEVKDLNKTFLVLIPKLAKPEKINQFLPIAICSVLYKGISKLIMSKLKPLLNKLISPQQVSFVPQRQIQDNIIIAQEMVHSMNRMKGKMGFFTIKIDLEKAYDKMSWKFIYKVLSEINIPESLVNIIMQCITSTELEILWNGSKAGSILPSRGLRQGDPISPYIFVLCMEKLTHLISDAIARKEWKPMAAGRGGPTISHLLFADDLLLFGEANIDQVKSIMNCLTKFGNMSGQKVSYPKSNIFFSKNVPIDVANAIVKISGFAQTKNLGRYLGYRMKHGRTSKLHYGEIMDRVNNRLNGWKKQCLSMAGRVTLVKSVISTIPMFHMQNSLLPVGICEEIEKKQRNFIWGDTDEQRKHHAIGWEQLQLPKNQGGLGILNLRSQNEAFIQKCAWHMVQFPSQLWVQVLLSKYGRKKDILKEVVSKPYDSHLWKSLCKIWPQMISNTSWQIGNGMKIDFWKDNWTRHSPNLLAHSHTLPSQEDLELKINNSIFLSEGGWNVQYLVNHFDLNVVNKILAIPHPDEEAEEDSLAWSNWNPGQSIVKLAYNNLLCSNNPFPFDCWDRIWKWKGKERVKLFIWKMLHGRILTRESISKWSGTSNKCPFCPEMIEDCLHVFRDCWKARKIWLLPMLHPLPMGFLTENSFKEWMILNLNSTTSKLKEWRDFFFTICYYLWFWRNKEIHEEEFKRPQDPSKTIAAEIEENRYCWAKFTKTFTGNSHSHLPAWWNRPEEDFLKLNVDGAVQGNRAACGGLLRDKNGLWTGGFSAFIGSCIPLHAELWALLKGLDFAWKHGWRKLVLETDSSQAFSLLTNHGNDTRKLPLVAKIRVFLQKEWTVLLNKIPRSSNTCADWIAKKALEDSFGLNSITSPHSDLLNLLATDLLDPGLNLDTVRRIIG